MQRHLIQKQRRPNSLFCLAPSYYKTIFSFLYVIFYLSLCLEYLSILKGQVTSIWLLMQLDSQDLIVISKMKL